MVCSNLLVYHTVFIGVVLVYVEVRTMRYLILCILLVGCYEHKPTASDIVQDALTRADYVIEKYERPEIAPDSYVYRTEHITYYTCRDRACSLSLSLKLGKNQ